MTVQTQKNTIQHIAVEGQDTYGYDFIILNENDVQLTLGPDHYLGGFTVTGIPSDSGTIILDDPISAEDDGKILTIARIMDYTQNIDYTAYDGFPAETHEKGLDRGILIAQQNAERILSSLRMPIGDDAIVILPGAVERAEKFLFFDEEGNTTVYDAEIATPAVLRIDIQDGTGGEDSTSLLQSEVVTGGPNFPKIGFRNINKPNGPLQLNEQGNVPFDNIGFSGVQLLGPFRGDDLCDKEGDDPGDCVAPDTRNPSERFTDLHPSGPGEQGKFTTGDTFLLSFQDPEIAGTMNLLGSIGDAAPSILAVAPRDGIMFLTGWDAEGVDLPNVEQGWYHIPKMTETGDASFIVYDDSGNTYVLGNNVQVALDAIDNVFLAKDAFFPNQQNVNRFGYDVIANDLNAIAATGFYNVLATDANSPTPNEYSLVHTQANATSASQVAVRSDTGDIFIRSYDGAWGAWIRLATRTELTAVSDVADQALSNAAIADGKAVAAQNTADLKKNEQDFIRSGTRLDINNVRTS